MKDKIIKIIEKLNIWQPECNYICVDRKELNDALHENDGASK